MVPRLLCSNPSTRLDLSGLDVHCVVAHLSGGDEPEQLPVLNLRERRRGGARHLARSIGRAQSIFGVLCLGKEGVEQGVRRLATDAVVEDREGLTELANVGRAGLVLIPLWRASG